ncbi:MAG: sulfurtransferase [Acidocella sp.]|nr:sulfurtransferase [Acidocella sp.]
MTIKKNLFKNLFASAIVSAFALGSIAANAATTDAPPLVTPAWLAQHINDKNLVVIEVYDHDNQAAEYQAAHVPGAVFTGFLDDKWRLPNGAMPAMLPPQADAAKVIGSFGVGNNSRVVLVPGGAKKGDFPAVTRIFWTLKVEGLNNVSILNGGDVAWQADKSDPVATGTIAPQPVVFTPHFNASIIATRDMVAGNLKTNAHQLVDARPVPQFEGKVMAPVDVRSGTVPGALNLPFSALFTADNEGVLDTAALQAALTKATVKTTRPTIAFCNTGHLASSDWFVMHELLHMPVRLYDGSMSEWSRDASLPMVAGKSNF